MENQWERLRVINRVVSWVNNISRGKDDRRKITSNAKIIVGRENRAGAEDTATNENLSAI